MSPFYSLLFFRFLFFLLFFLLSVFPFLPSIDAKSSTAAATATATVTGSPRSILSASSSPEYFVFPPRLQFPSAQPTFIPSSDSIDFLNPFLDRTIEILSVSTRSVHFQLNSIPYSRLPPQSRLKLAVTYLPREPGSHSSFLVFKTNVGEFSVPLYGSAVRNPYQLEGIPEISLSQGAQVFPPLFLYNPFDRPLQVREILSTEPFLQLSIPSEEANSKAPMKAKLWEVPPKDSRFLVNLAFHASRVGSFSGFVQVKTDQDSLMIPVSFRVFPDPLHFIPQEIHFGTLTHKKQQKTRVLTVENLGFKPVMISNIRAETPDSRLQIVYSKGILLPPRTKVTTVALISYVGKDETPGGTELNGKILIYTNLTRGNSMLEIMYRGRVIHGSLSYAKKQTMFSMWRKAEADESAGLPVKVKQPQQNSGAESGDSHPADLNVLNVLERSIELSNRFSVPLLVQDVSLSSSAAGFTLVESNYTRIAQPGEKFSVCRIRFEARLPSLLSSGGSPDSPQPYSIELKIRTNITTLRLPLHVFSGQLSLTNVPIEANYRAEKTLKLEHSPALAVNIDFDSETDEPSEPVKRSASVTNRLLSDVHQHGSLAFGRVRIGESRRHLVTLTNRNPIDMTVFQPQSSSADLRVCFLKSSLSPTSLAALLGINVTAANSTSFVFPPALIPSDFPFSSSLSSSASPDASHDTDSLKRIYTALPISIVPPTVSITLDSPGLPVLPEHFHPHVLQVGGSARSWSEKVEFHWPKNKDSNEDGEDEDEDEDDDESDAGDDAGDSLEEDGESEFDSPESLAVKASHTDSSSLCDPEPTVFLQPGESVSLLFHLQVNQPTDVEPISAALPDPQSASAADAALARRDALRQAIRDGAEAEELESIALSKSGAPIVALPGLSYPPQSARVLVATDREERAIDLSVSFQPTSGQLNIEPEEIHFLGSLAGLRQNRSIFAFHTFPHPITLFPLESSDPRVTPRLIKTLVQPGKRTLVGEIHYDPSKTLDQWMKDLPVQWTIDSTQKPHKSGKGKKLQSGQNDAPLLPSLLALTSHQNASAQAAAVQRLNALLEADFHAIRISNVEFQRFQRDLNGEFTGAVQLVTDVTRPQWIAVSARPKKPKFSMNSSIDFGLIPQETRRSLFVNVENPTDQWIQYQILPPIRTQRWQRLNSIPNAPGNSKDQIPAPFFPSQFQELIDELDIGPCYSHSAQPLDRAFSVSYSSSNSSLVLPPRGHGRLGPIEFLPQYFGTFRSYLPVRNNFTRLEFVGLRGESGAGHIQFRAAKGKGELKELKFNLTEFLHAKPQEKELFLQRIEYSRSHESLLPVNGVDQAMKLPFRLINTGVAELQVKGLLFHSEAASSSSASDHSLTPLNPDSHDACRLTINHGLLVDGCSSLPALLQPGQSLALTLLYAPTVFRLPSSFHLLVATSWGDYSLPIRVITPAALSDHQVQLPTREAAESWSTAQLAWNLIKSFVVSVALTALFSSIALFFAGRSGQLSHQRAVFFGRSFGIPVIASAIERLAELLNLPKDIEIVKQESADVDQPVETATETAVVQQPVNQQSGKKNSKAKKKQEKTRANSDEKRSGNKKSRAANNESAVSAANQITPEPESIPEPEAPAADAVSDAAADTVDEVAGESPAVPSDQIPADPSSEESDSTQSDSEPVSAALESQTESKPPSPFEIIDKIEQSTVDPEPQESPAESAVRAASQPPLSEQIPILASPSTKEQEKNQPTTEQHIKEITVKTVIPKPDALDEMAEKPAVGAPESVGKAQPATNIAEAAVDKSKPDVPIAVLQSASSSLASSDALPPLAPKPAAVLPKLPGLIPRSEFEPLLLTGGEPVRKRSNEIEPPKAKSKAIEIPTNKTRSTDSSPTERNLLASSAPQIIGGSSTSVLRGPGSESKESPDPFAPLSSNFNPLFAASHSGSSISAALPPIGSAVPGLPIGLGSSSTLSAPLGVQAINSPSLVRNRVSSPVISMGLTYRNGFPGDPIPFSTQDDPVLPRSALTSLAPQAPAGVSALRSSLPFSLPSPATLDASRFPLLNSNFGPDLVSDTDIEDLAELAALEIADQETAPRNQQVQREEKLLEAARGIYGSGERSVADYSGLQQPIAQPTNQLQHSTSYPPTGWRNERAQFFASHSVPAPIAPQSSNSMHYAASGMGDQYMRRDPAADLPFLSSAASLPPLSDAPPGFQGTLTQNFQLPPNFRALSRDEIEASIYAVLGIKKNETQPNQPQQ